MILGSKPLAEMSVEEMHAAMQELRSSREALRNEAIKDKAAREAKGVTGASPVKRERKPKAPDEADNIAAAMLRMMKEE